MPMEKISYKLEVFEGPMDLLLHLITKHKLNIYDIPIMELVEQYTDYIRRMEEADMEVASEFLEMAARLVYIKTVSLLPSDPQAQELKQELTGELLEYRDCKLMAQKLSERTDGFLRFTREATDFPIDYTYNRLHEPEELYRAYLAAAGAAGDLFRRLRRRSPASYRTKSSPLALGSFSFSKSWFVVRAAGLRISFCLPRPDPRWWRHF